MNRVAILVAAAALAACKDKGSAGERPTAEPPAGKRHVVVKGETLTSIAKQYNIAVADLQKANKGIDERKLQIGQTLTIPMPSTPESTTEKKENP